MTYSSCLSANDRLLVLDASVFINLAATGVAQAIITALPGKSVVPEHVYGEIDAGNHDEAVVLRQLKQSGIIERVSLEPTVLTTFGSLVSGSTTATLGDGEASTIAIAHMLGGVAVIDEKKGWKIAGARFESLRLATSIDLLAMPNIRAQLGDKGLKDAVLSALMNARMQVRENQLNWVVDIIGEEEAMSCSSLARLMRQRPLRKAS